MHNKRNYNSLIISLLLFFAVINGLYAQQFESLTLGFNAACVQDNYNDFPLKFRWKPPYPSANNNFIIELSDENGSFSNPKLLKTITDKNTVLEVSTTVALPKTEIGGENYKIRISSTNPATSIESIAFPAYYVNVASALILNDNVSDVALCPGHTTVLSIKDPTAKAYRWYRDDVLIPNQKGSSLTVSQAGKYYVTIDFGSHCSTSNNSRSRNVEVTISGSIGVTVSATGATTICKGNSVSMNSSITDTSYTYKWYRNGALISGASGSSYTTPTDDTAVGVYQVGISKAGLSCEELSNSIEVKFTDNVKAKASADGGLLLIPGQTKVLSVETDAQAPTYQWLKDGAVISGANGATYSATEVGSYSVKVTQGGTCPATAESNKVTLEGPTTFKVTIKHKRSYYRECLFNQTEIEVDKIIAVTASNGEVEVPSTSYSAFTYEWKNESGATITDGDGIDYQLNLTDASKNGTYTLKISTPQHSAVPESNSLTIKLVENSTVRLRNDRGDEGNINLCSGTTILTAINGDPDATYTWFKDGVVLTDDSGVGKTSLEVFTASSEGNSYYVSVSTSAACPALSNAIMVSKDAFSVNWAKSYPTKNLFFNGNSFELVISHSPVDTPPTIKWFRDGTEIVGASSTTYVVMQKGSYRAEVEGADNQCGKKVLSTISYLEPTDIVPTIGYGTLAATCDEVDTITSTTIKLTSIKGIFSDGTWLPVPKSDYSKFSFDWLKSTDGSAFVSLSPPVTTSELEIENNEENKEAEYRLRVQYLSWDEESEELQVSFAKVPDYGEFYIQTAKGNKNKAVIYEDPVTLTVAFKDKSYEDIKYSYQWYKVYYDDNGDEVEEELEGETAEELIVSESGMYRVQLSTGICVGYSDTFVVRDFDGEVKVYYRYTNENSGHQVYDGDTILLDTDTELEFAGLPEGDSLDATWTIDGLFLSSNFVVPVTKEGVYKVIYKIPMEDEDTGAITIEEEEITITVYDVKNIPNLITPNGDGINDYWRIPLEYTNFDTTIKIYSQEGKLLYKTRDYQNDWPSESVYKTSKTANDKTTRTLQFFYLIEQKGSVVKKGVINLIR